MRVIGRAEAGNAFSSEFVINVSQNRVAEVCKVDPFQATMGWGCLVRLSRASLFILYAQPKTPIDSIDLRPPELLEGDHSACKKKNFAVRS
jgi:hypothetical protein